MTEEIRTKEKRIYLNDEIAARVADKIEKAIGFRPNIKVENGRARIVNEDVPLKHTCHWPGCEKEVPPAMWGCKGHWFTLPKALRDKVWATYRRGQEITKTPSTAYVVVAKEVQEWIAQYQQNMRHHGSKSK